MSALALALLALTLGEGEQGVELRSALKSTALLSRQNGDDAAVSLWRLRLEPRIVASDRVAIELAWDLTAQLQSGAAALPGLAVATPETAWRLLPLEAGWGNGSYQGAHQLDRLFVTLDFGRARATVGRQALGYGRGVVFSAVDLFSPFSPLQIDREWRRGVDAVRLDVKIFDRVSLDGAVVLSPEWARSAAIARARGYLGPVDVELLGGWRAGDSFAGLASSGAVLGAEVHGELAAFNPESGRPWVLKAVAGLSYDFQVGAGLHALAEYHYNGFGLRLPKDLAAEPDPAFQQRLLRGDMQVIGRHAVAATVSYPVGLELQLSLTALIDPTDGSGLVAPAVAWDFAEQASLAAGAYAAWGAGMSGTRLGSQFGATPASLFLQLRLYDARKPPSAR